MLYVTREDVIDTLALSARSNNSLHRAGIHTVGQLMDYPADAWLNIRNLGQKSMAELQEIRARLAESRGLMLVESRPQTPARQAAPPRLPEIPIEELGLSVRAVNALTAAGIRTAAGLSDATRDSLMSIKNMGAKTVREILDKLNAIRKEMWLAADPALTDTGPIPQDGLYDIARAFAVFPDLTQSEVLRQLTICRKEHPEADAPELLPLLYQTGLIRREARNRILQLLDRREDGMSRQSLLEHLPAGTSGEVLEGLLDELIRREQAAWRGDLAVRRYPTALEFAQRLGDERSRDILLSRLHGETLEETGQRYGLTRERVRQITQKALSHRPRLREDRYQYLFEQYEFSREEFRLAFDEPAEVYNYLEMLRTRGGQRKPIQEILKDEKVSVSFRRKAERAVYRQYVTLDGIRVRKTRSELTYYTVRTCCRELTSMDDFLQWYQIVLESVGLENDPSLSIEARSYENKLGACDYVLWNQWHRFRYYPIQEREYDTLLETLDLTQYEDLEISSLKLFRDYPELMREYDVRDEYELHNLLKKVWPEGEQLVRFKKMPTIEIGVPDRDRQVRELLVRCAPVSNTELAQRYEELYGAKSATVLANYLSCIDQYFHNGIYRIDQSALPEAQHARMAALLTDDFYRIAEIRRIYLREFPGAAPENINPFTLKSLGFRIYMDYVITEQYSSAASYFRHLLTESDIVDMSGRYRQFSDLQGYYSELSDLKSRREIVEFAPNQYISLRRLQASGVTAGSLESYCAAVSAHARPGEYFTINSLRRNGFTHPLDDLGFEDWFYASLLAEDQARFSYRRMGGTRVFRRGGAGVQMVDFLRWLVEAAGRMDIYDLQETLERQYRVSIPFYKLTAVIQSSELYYDAVMEAVYIDYDTYLEEI